MAPAHRPFHDRRDAGRQLAAALMHLKDSAPVVLGLPRGGVPVAYEVAQALGAPLDVLLVRKIGAPFSSELGIGAVVEGDPPQRVLNTALLESIKPAQSWIDEEAQRQIVEIKRRRQQYCGGRQPIPLSGRTVILVDDGIATGSTMRAALKGLRNSGARRVIFAAPVAPLETIDSLRAEADDGICLLTPGDFHAVSQYYTDFAQTSDQEVVTVLEAASAAAAGKTSAEEAKMKSVSEIMTRDVTVVAPNDSVLEAARLMSDRNFGSLPVCDGRRLLGMITDRDIATRALPAGRTPDQLSVSEVMTAGVSWCFENQTLGEVLQQMSDDQLRRLPVVDRDMQLVGIVSISDLATRSEIDLDDAIQRISSPPAPARPTPGSGRHT